MGRPDSIYWSDHADEDVFRLIEFRFRQTGNYVHASGLVNELIDDIQLTLLGNPRIGRRMDEHQPDEVRRLLVYQYEIRYQIIDAEIYILRVFHTLEDR
jgi:plasmid stabilization system protein ParE